MNYGLEVKASAFLLDKLSKVAQDDASLSLAARSPKPVQRVASSLDDIVDTAARSGSLKAFSSVIASVGLLQELRGGGPFTVFVPTDDAFGRIGEHVLQSWLRADGSALLAGIVKYHILAGRLPAAEIIRSSTVRTEQGTGLTIRFTEGRMHVNNAKVIQADIECSNGIIHIIDTVVIPR